MGGARLERGYHHLFTSDTDIIGLNEEIGLGDRMTWIDSSVGTLYDGRIYNFVTPMDLLRFKPLSLVDRIRLGVATLALQRIKDWRRLESVTAVEWLRKWAGEGAFDGFWGADAARQVRRELLPGDRDALDMGQDRHPVRLPREGGLARESLGYPIGSFGEFFDVLAEKIEAHGNAVHLATPVTRIAPGQGRPALEFERPDGSMGSEEFDAVIATTHSYMFMRLAPDLSGEYRERLESTKYLAAVLLILVLDRPLSHIYWLNVADRSMPFVGVIEHTNLIPPEHYGGQHLVYLSNYLKRTDRLYGLSHEELLDECVPHLRKVNPRLRPVVGRQELPPAGQRGPAGDRHPLLEGHAQPQDAAQWRLPRQHHAGLPPGQGHQLQRTHGQTGRADGDGRQPRRGVTGT